MSLLVANAWAADPASQSSGFEPLIMLALFGLVFYFLLIRPQNKRLKEHKALIAAVTRGDTVVTNGGLIGKVVKVADGELTLDLGNAMKVKVIQSMIADVRNKTAPANDTEKPAKKK